MLWTQDEVVYFVLITDSLDGFLAGWSFLFHIKNDSEFPLYYFNSPPPKEKKKKKWKNWRQKKNLYIFGIFFRKYMGMNDITQLIFLIFNNPVAYIEIEQNQTSHQCLFSIYKGQDTMLRARKMQRWGRYVLTSRTTH